MLDDNRDIYVLKLNPETGIYKHIETLSPEREVHDCKYAKRKYFHPISSHEDLRKKAASYAKEGYILLVDCVRLMQDIHRYGSQTYYQYDGYLKI